MNNQHTPQGTLSRGTYDALLVHLTREKTWLQSARDTLLSLRHGVVRGDLALLDAAVREQSALAAARDELSAARGTLLAQAAAQLGIRERPVTLGRIAAKLSPQGRKPFIVARRELACGARTVQGLSGGALAIILQQRQIVDGVLGDLLGATPTEARYTADGLRQDGAGRALVECRS
jgi:hypothetical protein